MLRGGGVGCPTKFISCEISEAKTANTVTKLSAFGFKAKVSKLKRKQLSQTKEVTKQVQCDQNMTSKCKIQEQKLGS